MQAALLGSQAGFASGWAGLFSQAAGTTAPAWGGVTAGGAGAGGGAAAAGTGAGIAAGVGVAAVIAAWFGFAYWLSQQGMKTGPATPLKGMERGQPGDEEGSRPEDEGYQTGGVVPRTHRALVHAGEIVGPIDFMAQALQHAIAGLRPEAASGLIAAMPWPATAIAASVAASQGVAGGGTLDTTPVVAELRDLKAAFLAKDAGVTVAINGDILDSRGGEIAARVGGAIVRAALRNSPTDQGVGLRTGLREALGVR